LIQREPSEAQQNLKEQQGESELSLSKPNEKKKVVIKTILVILSHLFERL